MKRADRTRLLLRTIERLSQDEWPTVDLIAGQFEGRRTDDFQGSKSSYIGWSLENISDAALEDLAEYLGFTDVALTSTHGGLGLDEVAQAQRIWGDTPRFRLFLSHVSSMKEYVSTLKKCLSAYGISAFVAHADIQPTKEWLDEILRALKTMDGLAALLVPDFHNSYWTDQEVGYALSRNVPILPLKFNQDPYGFFGRYQALNCASLTTEQVALNVVRLLLSNPQSATAVADALGREFGDAGSWARAKELISLLEVPTTLSQPTLSVIAKAKCSNSQVASAFGVPERVDNVLRKNGFVDPGPPKTEEPEEDAIPF